MTTNAGFGKDQPKKQTAKKNKAKRAAASQQYNQMKQTGSPEFNIFVRIKDNKNWFPAGSMTVERSNQIDQAMFQQEAEMLQGVFRLFPKLRKHQDELEYGHRLKEFPDEPITLAVRPQPIVPNLIQSAVSGVKELFPGIFKGG
jgi:Family of unknown function (DUF6523)